MKTKVWMVILTVVWVMGFSLSLLNGEEHCWKFDETIGINANDSCGKIKVNGDLKGCAIFLPGGEGVYLNGSDTSFVTFGNTIGQFKTDDFTVYLDFKTNEKLEHYDIVGNRTDPIYGSYLSIRVTGNGKVGVEVCEDASGKNYSQVVSKKDGWNDGTWHTLVVVRIGKTLSLYIDQEDPVIIKSEGIASINNGNDFRLGRSLIDEGKKGFTPVAVYKNLYVVDKRALTPAEIKKMYEINKKNDDR